VLGEHAIESAVETLTGQLMLGRAHAMHSGKAIELRVVTRPSGEQTVEAVEFDPARRVLGSHEIREAAGGADDGATMLDFGARGDAGPDEELDALPFSWANHPVPRGITISARPPDDDADDAAAFGSAADETSDLQEPGVVRVAVYLSDGSAVLSRAIYVWDESGRCRRISINPWTGVPAAEVVDTSPGVEEDEPVAEFEAAPGESGDAQEAPP
jgi:hypothetical protein